MMLEVRCCCVPEKLLGYLPAPPKGETAMTFAVKSAVTWSRPMPVSCLPEAIRLEVQEMEHGTMDSFSKEITRRTWLCYKAEGVPVEMLERIPQFLRAHR